MALNANPNLPKRGLATEWTAANTVLGIGEVGYETDTGRTKRGDGGNGWTLLPYEGGAAGTSDFWHDLTATAPWYWTGGSPPNPVQYRKEGGVVWLRGVANVSPGSSATPFTLPVGYRPGGSQGLVVTIPARDSAGTEVTGHITIYDNGYAQPSSAYTMLTLDNVSFLAEG